MRTETAPRPAALAILAYVIGLAAAPVLADARGAALGLGAIALLVLALRVRFRTITAVLCAVCVLGLVIGDDAARQEAGETARLAERAPDAFSIVRLEIEDGWTPRPDGAWRLRARSFEVVDEEAGVTPVEKRIYLLLYDEPPAIDHASHLVARGFLRRLEREAFVVSVKSSKLLEVEGRASRLDPRTWNRMLAAALESAAAGSERAGEGSALVQALVLGRGALVRWEVIDLYQRGGTYHLLVFSGVQIAMMAALVRWILVRLRWRRTADAALLLICAFMPRFVGSDPSVSRSALMIGLLIGCWLWERPTDASNLVFVSALVRLVLVPEDLTDPGFALTYSATAGILVVGRALAEGRGRVGRVVAYGLGADLGTTPFTLLFFNRATIGGSLVTLLVSPIVTAMLCLGFVAVLLAPIHPDSCRLVLEIVGLLNEPVLGINRVVAESVRLSLVAAAPHLPVMVCALPAALVAAAVGSRRGALVAGLALLVPIGSTIAASLPDRSIDAEIHFLDVGQGDATLVTSRGRAMLVDGGGSSSDPAFGTRTLLPLLAERRVRTVDAVVLSHPHPDHCSGLAVVLRDLDVRQFVISKRHLATDCGTALVDVAMKKRIPVADAESVRSIVLGEVGVEIFGTSHRYRRAWENNSSVLVRIGHAGRRALLTGDIEREAERVLVEQAPQMLAAEILKVPHHGSRSSTTTGFVGAVGPRVAVISAGVRNRYGHPHDETEETLGDAGARVERTSTGGSIAVSLSGGRVVVRREFDSGRP